MEEGANSLRIWIFRALVIAVSILMLVSFALPWWTINFDFADVSAKGVVQVFGYGLKHSGAGTVYVADDFTPLYQNILAWVYIALSSVIVILCAFFKSKIIRLAAVAAGLIYIIYAIITVFVVVAGRAESIGYALFGPATIIYPAGRDTVVIYFARLNPGYYLAYVSGFLAVILISLRSFIIGKPENKNSA
jgi:hypothetical protein